MNAFQYKQNKLHAENVCLTEIAEQFGTPCYVYSRHTLENNWDAFSKALSGIPHRLCYAVKANSNIAILNLFAKKNSGFDIVSGGELARVLAAGGKAENIVFSGVGKQTAEIQQALRVGIACFNVESSAELEHLNFIAQQEGKIASVALRINPNIDARTHPYIATGLHENKFGMEIDTVLSLCKNISAFKNIKLIGIACHIGSQLTELSPFMEALDCLLIFNQQLLELGISLEHINIGGGLGIIYSTETPPTIQHYIAAIKEKIAGLNLEIVLEPGRAIVANAGILLTRVEYLKQTPYKNFAIVDAGMNDLIRPALYDAWQDILPVTLSTDAKKNYDVVGPVCESADFLGKNRQLSLQKNDLLAISCAGAYGFSMSSNYNSRPRVAEVIVDGNKIHLIRKRETINELFASETIITS